MITRLLTCVSVLILVSCASTGGKMHRINPGMPTADVIGALGKPRSVGGGSDVEVLHYRDDRGFWQYDYYFVRLVEGKVDSYGPESKDNRVTATNPALKPQK